MKYLIPILILSVCLLIQNCKTTAYTPDDYPENQIIFGSGGGFAGTYNYYYLFENGELYKNSTTDEKYLKVKKVKKNQVKQVFNNYDLLKLKDYTFNDPGNISYFIHFKNKEVDHKIQWGGGNEVIDKNVDTMYKILMSFTK